MSAATLVGSSGEPEKPSQPSGKFPQTAETTTGIPPPPPQDVPLWKRLLNPTPSPAFTTTLITLCAFSAAITAANLYYTYPILNLAAASFGVTYQRASLIPQLLQAGYGIGILLLCPLGDVVRLRPLMLTLTLITTLTWLGLCLTPDFNTFVALSFLTGIATVGPQILLPLIGTLAPPERKATAVSIVLAGMLMGLAVPRVVAGVATQYTPWGNIYWFALGLQTFLLGAMWFLFPDFPRQPGARKEFGTRYVGILRDIIRMAVTEPVLAYGCVAAFLINAIQASFWTTLTAHLTGPPRGFEPLQVGLFSIIAVGTTLMIPLYSWLVVERFETWFASVLGMVVGCVFIVVDAFAGDKMGSVAGPLLQAVAVDFGLQCGSVAYRAAVYRKMSANRANVAFTGSAFIGQLVGTSVGNAVYAWGGWMRLGMVHLVVAVVSLGVVFLRGPRETRWVGWRGGAVVRLEVESEDEKTGDA
ncbi:hypothetical protein OQA88_1439 [Cercophora sp. LCS_1]